MHYCLDHHQQRNHHQLIMSRFGLFACLTAMILIIRSNMTLLTNDRYCLPDLLLLETTTSSSPPVRTMTTTATATSDSPVVERSNNVKDNNIQNNNANDEVYQQDSFYTPRHNWTTYRYPPRLASLGRKDDNDDNNSSSFIAKQQQAEAEAVLVGVLSAAQQRAPRDWIRQTWANQRHNVYFLIGGNWTVEIQNEFRHYQDLIWIDAPEAYRAITLKVLSWYAVLHQHVAPNVYQYVMKTDDDSYVRLLQLEEEIRTMQQQQQQQVNQKNTTNHKLYWGAPCTQSRVIRDPQHKWHVSVDMFAPDKYPRYASGAGYLLHSSLVACMFRQMQETDYLLPIEDAFTGVLVDRCHGTCVRDERFPSHQQKYRANDDDDDNGGAKNTAWLVQHHIKRAADMERLHRQTMK